MGTDSEVLVQKQLINFKWRLIHALKQEPQPQLGNLGFDQ